MIKIGRFIPGIILGFLVIIGLALFGDIKEVSHTLNNFNWGIYPIAILFTLFNYALRFLKWHCYLREIGVKEITWFESMRIFIAGFPLAVTPGKVGEVLKGIWLNNLTQIPIAKGISVVFAERISDGLAVIALSTFGVIVYPDYWIAFLAIALSLLLIVILSQIRSVALWALNIGSRLPVINRVINGLREFYEGSYSLFRPHVTLYAVGLGIISWLGEGIGFFFILYGLGLPLNIETLGIAIFVLSFSTVVGAASALPGGLGAAEVSIIGMLTLILHVTPSIATSATLLIRFATLWFGIGLGLLVWVFSPKLFIFRLLDEKFTKS